MKKSELQKLVKEAIEEVKQENLQPEGKISRILGGAALLAALLMGNAKLNNKIYDQSPKLKVLVQKLEKAKADKDQEKIMIAMQKANDEVVRNLKEGQMCEEINKIPFKIYHEYGLSEFIRHRIGHGMGFEGHEAPWLSPGDKMSLAKLILPNFIVSIFSLSNRFLKFSISASNLIFSSFSDSISFSKIFSSSFSFSLICPD